MDQPIVTPFYLDKALWLTVLGIALPILNAKFGLGLNAEEIIGLLLPIATYVVMHKWKTAKLQAVAMASDAGQAAAAKPGPGALNT